MQMNVSPSSSVRRYTMSAEEFLEEFDAFIRAQARKNMFHTRSKMHPDILDMEAEELAQKIRIKVWQAYQKQYIDNPKAYISRAIHNESISMLRQQRPTCPLPLDEDGEMYQGDIVFAPSWGTQDPLEEVEQNEMTSYCLRETVKAILDLPKRQQRAMICSLKERVDDLYAFASVCHDHQIDINAIHWPTANDEVQNMRSSVTIARKKLRARVRACIAAS